MMKSFQLILCLLTIIGLVACSSKATSPADLYKNQNDTQIFEAGEKALQGKHYGDAIQYFEIIETRYPFTRHAEQGLLNLIYAYYKNDNIPMALTAADRYIRFYPQNAQVDYAYYMRGLIQMKKNEGIFEPLFPTQPEKRDLTGLKEAYVDFERLTRHFPKSPYVAEARQRMIYIRNLLAKHELEVAQFYFKEKAYVASANRANEIVKHYQETPAIPEALRLMEKSYRALGLNQEADDAKRVLESNAS